jgi:hypothetical protein
MEKYGFVYIWFDKRDKRYYIGCHWGFENDGYICSSTWMRNTYRRRPNDFKRRIIKRIYSSRQDLFLEEQKYLNMIKPEEVRVRYFNLHVTVGHWSSDENKRLTVGQKISASPNRAANIGKANKGKIRSDESKRKQGDAQRGTKRAPRSEETKRKIGEANRGRAISEETRLKMRHSRLSYIQNNKEHNVVRYCRNSH